MTTGQSIVLAGHGSQRHHRSAAPIHAHADRIRAAGLFDEVRTAFWKEELPLAAVRSTISSEVTYVVPVLTSEGYFAEEVFPRELGVAESGPGATSREAGPTIRYAEPVGTHEAMTEVIRDRVESSIDVPPSSVGVAVVGHGTERHERSGDSTLEHARRLRDTGRYGTVEALFLDEPPHVGDLYETVEAATIVVVPLFVADGHHTTIDIPEAIDHPGVGETTRVNGRTVHYAGAVGTEPSLASVIVERAREAGAVIGQRSTDLPSPASRWLAELVDASSEPVAWGQLRIADRQNGYELRHVEDTGRAGESLRRLERPEALRSTVRTDDRGRYRPLSGARSLPTGWLLGGLDEVALARAVRFVYPGTVAHRYREQRGALEVTDLPETVARQRGSYSALEECERHSIDAAVSAVCGDCVKGRRWSVEAAGARTVPKDGGIPCQEACPFFLSTALGLDDIDDPGTRESIDPSVPAAAIERPGNRYRVRYRRARFRPTPRNSDVAASGEGS